jgi:predicted GNAT family acetyltransferase
MLRILKKMISAIMKKQAVGEKLEKKQISEAKEKSDDVYPLW